MKRWLPFLFACFLYLEASASDGTIILVYIYQTTDVVLKREVANDERWRDFFFLTGDTGWAAYYAGRADHAREQLDTLYFALGVRPQ